MRTFIAIAAVVPLVLGNEGGCSSRPPARPYVAVVMPATPPECLQTDTAEPQLPDDDIDDDVAARDRRALKHALRQSNALRRVCRAALERRNRRD